MAALTETAAKRLHAATTSTTAETWGLTESVKSLRITNRDADPIFVTLQTSNTVISDDAGITPAVADADETFCIPGVLTSGSYQTREIFRSSRPTYVAGSIIGNVSTYDIEGYDWY